MNNGSGKTISIIAIVAGVLGIIIGFIGGILFGIIGGGIGCGLAAVAIVLGIFSKIKSGSGIIAVVLGVIALILSLIMIAIFSTAGDMVKKTADKYDCPTVSKYAEKMRYGVIGMVLSISEDGEDVVNQFSDEFKIVSDHLGE